MAEVSLAGNLPVGDKDGLSALAAELISEPAKLHCMIAVIDCAKVTRDTDTGNLRATVRIRRIEEVLAIDRPQLEKLIRRSLEARMGRAQLPLELEDELEQMFHGLDAEEAADPTGGPPIKDGDDDPEDPGHGD